MRKVVLVRYGEIAVKTWRFRRQLEELLLKNILKGLKKNKIEEARGRVEDGRIIVEGFRSEDESKVLNVVCKIFGVKSASLAVEVQFKKLEDIVKIAEDLWREEVKGKSFAVRCRRVGKHDFTSKDVERSIGMILEKYAREVDLENPEVELHVEIRHDKAYLYKDIVPGPGGLPLGSEGKALALVSGGFDSPVAAWLIMRRGVKIDFLTVSLAGELDLVPSLKVITYLADEWEIGHEPRIYVAHAEDLVKVIRERVRREVWNIVYKKALYYIADNICRRYRGYRAIVTGDVIGQVSSQTLDNLYSTSIGTTTPIIRPLAGYDKDEIIELSRKIGTYRLSMEVSEYCAVFAERPKTWSTPEEIMLEFYKIKNIVDKIIDRNIEILTLSEAKMILESLKEKIKINEIKINEIPDNSVILDVRPRKTFKLKIDSKDVKIIECSLDNVFSIVSSLGKDRTYIIFCTSPLVSRYIASKLREKGYNAYSLAL
ncbi:MAG: tRNA 4-thiouridine(8) synthase ThiI [Crenarchaeota archaeon]|nr:tRNA 4-thiouridine(8) synthase ThiI [Thermoproteota archaeon]